MSVMSSHMLLSSQGFSIVPTFCPLSPSPSVILVDSYWTLGVGLALVIPSIARFRASVVFRVVFHRYSFACPQLLYCCNWTRPVVGLPSSAADGALETTIHLPTAWP